MGRYFQVFLDSASVYSCRHCSAHISSGEWCLWRGIDESKHMLLFRSTRNVDEGLPYIHPTSTGLTQLCDIHCRQCRAYLGHKKLHFLDAPDTHQTALMQQLSNFLLDESQLQPPVAFSVEDLPDEVFIAEEEAAAEEAELEVQLELQRLDQQAQSHQDLSDVAVSAPSALDQPFIVFDENSQPPSPIIAEPDDQDVESDALPLPHFDSFDVPSVEQHPYFNQAIAQFSVPAMPHSLAEDIPVYGCESFDEDQLNESILEPFAESTSVVHQNLILRARQAAADWAERHLSNFPQFLQQHDVQHADSDEVDAVVVEEPVDDDIDEPFANYTFGPHSDLQPCYDEDADGVDDEFAAEENYHVLNSAFSLDEPHCDWNVEEEPAFDSNLESSSSYLNTYLSERFAQSDRQQQSQPRYSETSASFLTRMATREALRLRREHAHLVAATERMDSAEIEEAERVIEITERALLEVGHVLRSQPPPVDLDDDIFSPHHAWPSPAVPCRPRSPEGLSQSERDDSHMQVQVDSERVAVEELELDGHESQTGYLMQAWSAAVRLRASVLRHRRLRHQRFDREYRERLRELQYRLVRLGQLSHNDDWIDTDISDAAELDDVEASENVDDIDDNQSADDEDQHYRHYHHHLARIQRVQEQQRELRESYSAGYAELFAGQSIDATQEDDVADSNSYLCDHDDSLPYDEFELDATASSASFDSVLCGGGLMLRQVHIVLGADQSPVESSSDSVGLLGSQIQNGLCLDIESPASRGYRRGNFDEAVSVDSDRVDLDFEAMQEQLLVQMRRLANDVALEPSIQQRQVMEHQFEQLVFELGQLRRQQKAESVVVGEQSDHEEFGETPSALAEDGYVTPPLLSPSESHQRSHSFDRATSLGLTSVGSSPAHATSSGVPSPAVHRFRFYHHLHDLYLQPSSEALVQPEDTEELENYEDELHDEDLSVEDQVAAGDAAAQWFRQREGSHSTSILSPSFSSGSSSGTATPYRRSLHTRSAPSFPLRVASRTVTGRGWLYVRDNEGESQQASAARRLHQYFYSVSPEDRAAAEDGSVWVANDDENEEHCGFDDDADVELGIEDDALSPSASSYFNRAASASDIHYATRSSSSSSLPHAWMSHCDSRVSCSSTSTYAARYCDEPSPFADELDEELERVRSLLRLRRAAYSHETSCTCSQCTDRVTVYQPLFSEQYSCDQVDAGDSSEWAQRPADPGFFDESQEL